MDFEEGVGGWIWAHNPLTEAGTSFNQSELPSMKAAWEGLVGSTPGRTKAIRGASLAEGARALAAGYDCLDGKWLIYSPPQSMPARWRTVAEATEAGRLGPCSKVSQQPSGFAHVICVYTNNFTDEVDVMRVRNELRELGWGRPLHYKPDVYTYLGIYADTAAKLGMKATTYTSQAPPALTLRPGKMFVG